MLITAASRYNFSSLCSHHPPPCPLNSPAFRNANYISRALLILINLLAHSDAYLSYQYVNVGIFISRRRTTNKTMCLLSSLFFLQHLQSLSKVCAYICTSCAICDFYEKGLEKQIICELSLSIPKFLMLKSY